MKRQLLFASALAGILGGCAGVPDFDVPVDQDQTTGKILGPTVADVVRKIECEIWDATKSANKLELSKINTDLNAHKLESFERWVAAVTLTLVVDDTIGTPSAGLALSYLQPLKQASSFVLGANLIATQEELAGFV